MTGRSSRVKTRFQQAATFPLTSVWRGLRWLNLVAKREYSSLADDMFVTTLSDIIAYLRSQEIFTAETKKTCPKFVSTRRLPMTLVTEWLIKHRMQISEYLQEMKPACKSPIAWWMIILCLHEIATALAKTCLRLQPMSMLLSQKQAELNVL